MDKYSVYVGMDVHARSITAQALNVETGETYKKRFGEHYSASEIASWAKELSENIYCAYESGCTGVWLARELRGLGVDCDVIAVSTLARSTKDKQGKCDKLDARAILREITNRSSQAVIAPSTRWKVTYYGIRQQDEIRSDQIHQKWCNPDEGGKHCGSRL